LPVISPQRVEPDIFNRQVSSMRAITLAATASLTNAPPVGRSITPSHKTLPLHETLHQHWSIAIASSKILWQPPPTASQHLGGPRPETDDPQETLFNPEKIAHLMRAAAQLGAEVVMTFQERIIKR